MNVKSNKRRYDLDWIRVISTLGVFVFHNFMFFNPFPWHVKNNEMDSSWILVCSLFMGLWIMPLFFAVSGISTTYSLSKRRPILFLKERLQRIGIPLLFGVFILSPPQVYIERIMNAQFNGSFVEFIPRYFDGLYLEIGGEGNFAFSGLHLWYLLVLFVFSVISLAIFKAIPIKAMSSKWNVLLFLIILLLAGWINTLTLGGWDLVFYFIVFLFGCYFFSTAIFLPKSFYKMIAPVTVIATVIYIIWFITGFPSPGTVQDYLFYGVKVLACWGWLLVLVYLANNYLSFTNNFLNYTSEAAMPFYVLHQPIIVILGFMLYDVSWSIPLKLVVLLSMSFAVIMMLYHFVIRKSKLLRILFGLKG